MLDNRLSAPHLAILGFVLFAAVPLEASTPVKIESPENATVFVKVHRRLGQKEITTFGSAFFVHPKGFLVTSSSTVGQVIAYHIDGKTRRFKTEILGVTIVMDSGTPDETEHSARVLVEAPRSGHALLKIDFAISSPLTISSLGAPQIADEVTVVGYPFGDWNNANPRFNPSTDINPSMQTVSGPVTGMRQVQRGSGSIVETEITIQPSHPGAPLLNVDGDVVGVVAATSRGTASAIPLEALHKFIEKSAYKAVFSPPGIHPDLDRITVDIIPLLADLERITGTVCVEGRDLRSTCGRLSETNFGYRATVNTDDRMFGVQPPKSYDAEIAIRKPGASRMEERRFVLPATNTQIVMEHSPDVYKVDPEIYFPGDQKGLSGYARHVKIDGSSLADGDDDSAVRRSASGSLVIDQNAVSAFVGVPAEAFAELEDDQQKALASRFEVVFNEYCNLTSKHMIPIPTQGSRTDAQYRRLIEQTRAKVGDVGIAAWADYLINTADEADELTTQLRRQNMAKCADGIWRVSEPGCELPQPEDCL